jgi:hypothetical protein
VLDRFQIRLRVYAKPAIADCRDVASYVSTHRPSLFVFCVSA